MQARSTLADNANANITVPKEATIALKSAREFMSAARAAARPKPLVVIKSGRHREGATAAATHAGALAGSDAVYDAAFRRARLLRVSDLDDLFDAAETLGRLRSFSRERLAILMNGAAAACWQSTASSISAGRLLPSPRTRGRASTRRCRRPAVIDEGAGAAPAMELATDLSGGTRVARLLKAYGELVLVKLALLLH